MVRAYAMGKSLEGCAIVCHLAERELVGFWYLDVASLR